MIALAHYQICQLSICVIALSHLQAVCQQHCSEEALPWGLLWGLKDHQHLGETAFRFTIKVFRNPSSHCICNQLCVISVFLFYLDCDARSQDGRGEDPPPVWPSGPANKSDGSFNTTVLAATHLWQLSWTGDIDWIHGCKDRNWGIFHGKISKTH